MSKNDKRLEPGRAAAIAGILLGLGIAPFGATMWELIILAFFSLIMFLCLSLGWRKYPNVLNPSEGGILAAAWIMLGMVYASPIPIHIGGFPLFSFAVFIFSFIFFTARGISEDPRSGW